MPTVFQTSDGEYVVEINGLVEEEQHQCAHCAETEDLHRIDGRYVCTSCRDNHPAYQQCESCGEWTRWGLRTTNDGDLCSSCFHENSTECPYCGTDFYMGDGYYSDRDELEFCCSDCSDDYEREHHGLDWWSSDSVSWKPRGHGDLFMGVELEIDDGDSQVDFYEAARNNYDDSFFLYKTDGSLSDDGVEIVSHPATLHYHLDRAGWKGMLSLAKEHGYSSHDNGRCGLHIHLNNNFFGSGRVVQTACALRFMRLFDRFNYQFERFSRRVNFGYCRKNSIEPMDVPLMERVRNKLSYQEERYMAVNTQPSQTIEIRLWRGTLNYETFAATLQMTAGLAIVCKNKTEDYLNRIDWYSLCDEVAEAADSLLGYEATELRNYLSRRGLSNVEFDEVEEGVA